MGWLFVPPFFPLGRPNRATISALTAIMLRLLIAGPLLTHFGGCWTADCAATAAEQHQYSTPGYVAVMLLGAVYVICAGLMLRTVKAR